MKGNKLNQFKLYFKSFINNRVLFDFRKKTILIPILIFFLMIFLLSVPSYLSAKSIKGNDLMRNFPKIEKPIERLLTSSLDCTVKNGILTCAEDSLTINEVIGEENDIKYTVIANEKTIALDTDVVYDNPKNWDNMIFLYTQTIRIRYVHRDHVNKSVNVYEIIGDYSEFENFSFKEIADKIANNPEILQSEIQNFVITTYKSTLDTRLLVQISSSILSFSLLALVSCIIIKGKLRLKKGFKLTDSFKISMISSLPSIVISIPLALMYGVNMAASIFGFIFVGRIIFIYFKYIANNKIFKELYELEKNERYNIF